MEQVLIGIIAGVIQQVPALIAAIQASQTMTAEQKASALEKLSGDLQVCTERVKSVTFKDV